MNKILFLLLLLFVSLIARKNPFFPIEGEKEIPYSSNQDRTKKLLKHASLIIPSQARVIKRVTIEFKNLDGSIESRSIELDNAINWHLPIFISQSYIDNTKTVNEVIEKTIYKELSSIKFAKFYSYKKTLKIVTTDKLIRNFLLVNPRRIVIDFEKDANLKYMSKNNKNNVFTKIRVGNHNGYYRVVVELDGFYKYIMKKTTNGYLFTLL